MEALFHSDQATVGSMLAALQACEPEKRVAFDFADRAPCGIHPTPDLVGDLAFGHAALHDAHRPTVKRLTDVLRGAIHQKWTTLGGHEFKASVETRLWVGGMYSDGSRTVVTGICPRLSCVFVMTALWEVDE